MTTNPRSFVRPGDPLALAASQVNFLNKLMDTDTSMMAGPLVNWAFGGNVVLARNNTGADVPRWGVMRIGGIQINPAIGDKQRRGFESMPCVVGAMPDDTTGSKFVIAVEPIKAGTIGRVAVAGAVQAKVNFTSSVHTRAKPKAGSNSQLESAESGPAVVLWSAGTSGQQWALVRLDDGDTPRIGKVSADWDIGTCARVYITRELASDACCVSGEPGDYIDDVINLSFNVKAESRVLISKVLDRWFLLEVGKEGSCRDTIGGEDVTRFPGYNPGSVQLLGHNANGCLQWYNVTECATPSPGENPSPGE